MHYAATHIALALLEQLVHVSPARLPESFRVFAIDLAEDAGIEHGDPPPDDLDATRRIGDLWAASLRSSALIVPSVTVPALLQPGEIGTAERNALLNPRHRSAAAWRAIETSFRLDPRLRRRPHPGR